MRTELMPQEEVIEIFKKNWIVLLNPIIWIAILTFIIYFPHYFPSFFSGEYFHFVSIVLIVFFLIKFIYRYIDRQYDIWVVTNLRVIDEKGLFNRKSKESPLDKINNISYSQSILGRLFNYGEVQIQTAAEKGSSKYKYVEFPEILKDTIISCQDELNNKLVNKQKKKKSNSSKKKEKNEKTDITKEIQKLYDLKEKGIISEEEFVKGKEKLLNV